MDAVVFGLINNMKDFNYKDINIAYEDNKIIVAVKPQNIPSQEDSTGDMDMLRLMKQYRKENENKEGEAFVGLVHRLDRPTGGLMVFAKNSKAAANLNNQILQKVLKKTYFAVLRGVPQVRKGTLKNYLIKDEKNNMVRVGLMGDLGAKEAILEYEVVSTALSGQLSLVRINLITGRSHQIRVQMANIGNPVFGDLKYGAKENQDIKNENLNLALYSTDLSFISPSTGEKMLFRVYPPKDEIPWKLFNISTFLNITQYDN